MTSALLVVDMQESLLSDETPNPGEIVAAVADLVARARAAEAPVVWITDSRVGPDGALIAAFAPAEDDLRIVKSVADAFAETDLDVELTMRAVERVVICGMQSDACVTGTTTGASDLGYEVVLAADAHTTHDFEGRDWRAEIAAANAALGGLDRVEVRPAAEIDFAD